MIRCGQLIRGEWVPFTWVAGCSAGCSGVSLPTDLTHGTAPDDASAGEPPPDGTPSNGGGPVSVADKQGEPPSVLHGIFAGDVPAVFERLRLKLQ